MLHRFILALLCLLVLGSTGMAEELTGRDEALEAQLQQTWQQNLIQRYGADGPIPSVNGNTANWGCVIKRGGSTRELIEQRAHWELAIVSAAEVDLQQLADAGVLYAHPRYFPQHSIETHQWLHRDLWHLLPKDSTKQYDVFIYERSADDITLLLCNGCSSAKRSSNASDYAQTYLSLRTPDQLRITDGLACLWQATADMLLAAPPASWDMASLTISSADQLAVLDQAGLLFDLSQDAYLAQRQPLTRTRISPKLLPACIEASDGRMLALPYSAATMDSRGNAITLNVLVINPNSPCIPEALAYAVHIIKSEEWAWHWQETPRQPGAPALDRNDMTW